MTDLEETLIIVIPVYNEEGAIEAVLRDWHAVLSSLEITFVIKCYNDGSTDNTWDILTRTSETLDCIEVYNKINAGHGPTILLGYRTSLDSTWVFQVDSDNEVPAGYFQSIWNSREYYDLIIGKRIKKQVPLARKVISFVSRKSVAIVYGSRIHDVNSPFRLMRVSMLDSLIRNIPATTFAPNLLITGLAAHKGYRCLEIPVEYSVRQTGQVSIRKFKLFKVAAKAFIETIGFRLK